MNAIQLLRIVRKRAVENVRRGIVDPNPGVARLRTEPKVWGDDATVPPSSDVTIGVPVHVSTSITSSVTSITNGRQIKYNATLNGEPILRTGGPTLGPAGTATAFGRPTTDCSGYTEEFMLEGDQFRPQLRGGGTSTGGVRVMVDGNWLTKEVAEVQTMTAGDATGGTFTLTIDGLTTGAIAYNASAATIQAAIRAITVSSIVQYGVVVTGGPLGTAPMVVTFSYGAKRGDRGLMTVTSSLTGGADGTTRVPTIVETVKGKTDFQGGVENGLLIGGGNDGTWSLPYTFATRKRRHIVLYIGGVDNANVPDFAGIEIGPMDMVYPVKTPRKPKAVFLSDSWGFGTGTKFRGNCLPLEIGRRMGWDMIPAGLPGTGYVSGGVYGTPGFYANRLATHVAALNPDIVIVWGSINDGGKSGIQAAATQLYASVKATCVGSDGLPSTLIVIGVQNASGTPSPVTLAAANDVQAAATVNNNVDLYVHLISPTQVAAINNFGGYMSGTGKILNAGTDGISSLYTGGLDGNDGLHLNDAGYAYYADRIAGDIAARFPIIL